MYLQLLEKHIRYGQLNLHLPDGHEYQFGTDDKGPEATWVVHDPSVMPKIARNGSLQLGETYMDGAWDVEDDRLLELLIILMRNFMQLHPSRWRKLSRWLTLWRQQLNGIRGSRRKVAHHYDLDEALFRSFLDSDMHYSCAYFERPGMTLEQAQQAKCRHIMRKLCLQPGQRVLDIGSGWGSLGMYLAEQADVQVVGLTLSREQLKVARERVRERGLENRVRFELQDYRQHHEHYDRIVSVGMFEHVGRPYFHRFFDSVWRLLEPHGCMLLHSIGRLGQPGVTNAWINKYIFPGGYLPSLSELSATVEDTGLLTTDVEILRLHYADTLAAWRSRFTAQWEEMVRARGERFCRMWEFYLASCEASFRIPDLVVFQMQLARDLETVPRTRDYQYRDQSTREKMRLVN